MYALTNFNASVLKGIGLHTAIGIKLARHFG